MRFENFIEADVDIEHVRGSGPGGQNRNKRMSGVRVKHLPTGTVVVATERRSQAQNLHQALQRLDEKLAVLFHRPPPRHATRPSRSSKKERVEKKNQRGETKKMRRRVRDTDW